MAEQELREQGMDERDPYYGIHESDFTPRHDQKGNIDPHLVDKFLTFQADAARSWITAGMPMDKAMSLVRILHNFNFIMFGKSNIKMDMANVLAAYAGRDRMMLNTAERVATHTAKPSLDMNAASSFFKGVFGGHTDNAGVNPSTKGER